MIFWTIFILIVLILLGDWVIISKRYSKIRYYIGCSFVIFIAFIRYDVGYDYIAYYPLILNKSYNFEPISNGICMMLEPFNYPPLTISVFGLISYILVFTTIEHYSDDYKFGAIIYVCIFYLSTLTTIRQGLAVAVTFWGFKYIIQKKIIQFIIVCVIASLIHKSALIAIPIYYIYHYCTIKKTFVIILLVAFIISYIFLIFQDLGFYGSATNRIVAFQQGEDMNVNGRYMRYAFCMFTAIIILIAKLKKIKLKDNCLSILIIGISFPFLIGTVYGVRISEYFNIYMCIILPHVLKHNSHRLKILASTIFSIYFLLIVFTGTHQKRSPFTPYKTIYSLDDINVPHLRQP